MQKTNDPLDPVRHRLAEKAAGDYSANREEYDAIRERVALSREGQLDVVDVNRDEPTLRRRLAKESYAEQSPLERIIGMSDLQDVSIIQRLLDLSHSVCRIVIEGGHGGYGTGFLISDRVLITNHHVLPSDRVAADSSAQFGYELDALGRPREAVTFALAPEDLFITSSLERDPRDPLSGLDFTVVALRLERGANRIPFPSIPLDGGLGKILDGEQCIVIQHPKGDYKKIVLKDIRVITRNDDKLIYESDTEPGSSGSPVISMGTGQVVALHHSGVPATNAQGQMLTKTGAPAPDGTKDSEIKWIGNEGIRISRIVNAIRDARIPKAMDPLRLSLLDQPPKENAPPNEIPPATVPPLRDTITPISTSMTQPFEVLLSANARLRQDWERRAASLVDGFVRCEPLFPGSTEATSSRLYYLEVETSGDPWGTAARIEQLPHVETCTPDLPTLTDVRPPNVEDAGATTESTAAELFYDDGTTDLNESEFRSQWANARWVKDHLSNDAAVREWNWRAVNMPPRKATDKKLKALWETIDGNLPKLRFVQLDTGYSRHSKLSTGYDLERDMDLIGGDSDAIDEMDGVGLRQPGHGTRTASLAVGGRIAKDLLNCDGNRGLLTDNGVALARLIPYRISKSVVLIGRAKELVDAVQHAMDSGTDVMFMCMGSYPRPMIEAAAREAYYRGLIWVCAAGNEVEVVVAPALYEGTIAVAAINPDDRPWKGSSNGPLVDIAAPGEKVYVPGWDKSRSEVMSYGDGTSYATPHVASAAMLWKARHREALRKKYPAPWQVVEAFRYCLKASARTDAPLPKGLYGAGVLDLSKLLGMALPDPALLVDAYKGKPTRPSTDLGIREGLHYVWNLVKRKVTGGPTESFGTAPLSPRATAALEGLAGPSRRGATESALPVIGREQLLRELFNQPRR